MFTSWTSIESDPVLPGALVGRLAVSEAFLARLRVDSSESMPPNSIV